MGWTTIGIYSIYVPPPHLHLHLHVITC
jgi:hypothetical protein